MAFSRPILSPIGPKITDPTGRMNNPMDIATRVTISRITWFSNGKKCLDKIGKNGINSAKLYQTSIFPMALMAISLFSDLFSNIVTSFKISTSKYITVYVFIFVFIYVISFIFIRARFADIK